MRSGFGILQPGIIPFVMARRLLHGAREAADGVAGAARQALGEARDLGGDRAVAYFSAENSIEERLRGSGPSLDVIASEPVDDEADVRVVSRG